MNTPLTSGKSPLSGRGIALAVPLTILIPTAPHDSQRWRYSSFFGGTGSDRTFSTGRSNDRLFTDYFGQL
jgi:hypothetical protein